MRLLLFALLGLVLVHVAAGQVPSSARQGPGSVVGTVLDSLTRQPLSEASVSVLAARDSALVSFAITDAAGKFAFRGLAEGRYRIVVTFVGYRSSLKRAAITTASPTADVGTFELVPQSQTLGEVSIQGERAPVAVKGDTVEFNAGSFKTQPNAPVEDLLKKLPGVEVDGDGTVKAKGKDVKKILVDGKPFFGDDPKMATRNLPAEIIDKIQVYDQRSEQSQFSGVDDGEREVTINITTRRDRRKGTFGQQAVGIGPRPGDGLSGDDPRYSARLNVNRFNNGRQFSVMGMANNINQQGFSAQDLGLGGGVGSGPGALSARGGGGAIGRGGGGSPGFGGNNNAITRSLAGGLNYRDAWGKKIEVAGSYFVTNTNTLTDQRSRRENVLPSETMPGSTTASRVDSAFVTNRQNGSEISNTNHRFNLRFEYKIDSLTTLRILPSFSWLNSSYESQSESRTVDATGALVNTSTANNSSTGNGLNGSNNVLLLHRFRKRGRTVSLNWNMNISNQSNEGFNRSINSFATPNTPLPGSEGPGSTTSATGLFSREINQRNEQQTRSMTNGINLTYTEPLTLKQTLELHYTLSNNRNTSNRTVADYNETTDQYDRPNALLSNRFVNTFMTNRAGLTWQTRQTKFFYALGVDVQQAGLSSDNRTRDTSFTRTFTNVLPNALFTYTFDKNRSLNINYRTRINAPSVNQLQPVPDNTNPLNIRLGNASLQPEYSHSISLNYNRFQPATFRSMFVSVNASRTDNKIVNATTFTRAGAQTTQPINTDGYYSLSGFLSFGRPLRLKEQRVNLNLGTNLNYNQGISFINAQQNRSQNWSVGQRVGLNTNINEKLDVNLSGSINFQTARYSVQTQQNRTAGPTSFLNQTATLDLFYQLPFRFTVNSNVTYNNYGGGTGSFNQSFVLWNAALSRQFFKQKQGELRLQVFDLLNQNRSIVRNVTETYVEEVQSRVLNRYFTISFIYTLRRFGGAGQPNQPQDGQERQFRRMNREFSPNGPGNRPGGGERGGRRQF
ncbi:TonB-dependent receptor [Fibrisoma montanum]|uniref:TonB-dependent receptor n=1 Tax=Fibrisoma montanum TaxID=2305895 RepID=A0A418MFA2_9BACT|nr:outer membrane beta-barrel family protein [Fibrisoma montanum]RIV25461.1 TonB-dependent receptor [Fibrisoma montanum]